MAKIHGLVYILIGILVSAASWKINKEDLYLFFYAGILFIGAGAAKLLLNLMKNKKEETIHHRKIQPQAQHLQHYRRCKKCGSVMKVNDRFCPRCRSEV